MATDDDAPLVAGKIHGLRVWRIGIADGTAELRGHGDEAWTSGGAPTVARCLGGHRYAVSAPDDHRSPASGCSCGLYGLHPHASHAGAGLGWLGLPPADPGDSFPEQVVGIVEAWGRVELHAAGFRAEFARPHTLALIGAPRDSDVGDLIGRLAERYGAELVELEDAEELVGYCAEREPGLAPAVVRSLLADERPEPSAPAAAPPRPSQPPSKPKPPPSRLERLGTVAMAIAAVLWYAVLGVGAVFVAIGVGRAIFGSPPVEFPEGHLRIVDQALVELDDDLRYLAVVRNTSDQRVALAAFPHGSVSDRGGERIVRLDPRARIESRPSLLPGQTGLIVDLIRAPGATDLPERLRYETAIRARRAPAPEGAEQPLVLSRLSFDRQSCRLAASADTSRRWTARGSGSWRGTVTARSGRAARSSTADCRPGDRGR